MNKLFKTMFVLVVFLIAQEAIAGSLSVVKVLPATNDIRIGDEILISVDMLSAGTEYNAVEGVLTVGAGFQIERVITGSSFVSVWLDDPARFEDSTIKFSGIAPAGYNKEVGQTFSVVVRAVESGRTSIELSNVGLFANDGRGARTAVRETSLTLPVRAPRPDDTPYLISVKDETPPEPFTIELVRNDDLYGGKYALVWNALDKGSGIASYDVQEGRRVFKQAVSPHLLEKQSFGGKIYVKAYDHEGNVTVASLVPPGRFCVGDTCFGALHGGVVLIVLICIYFVWRRRTKH